MRASSGLGHARTPAEISDTNGTVLLVPYSRTLHFFISVSWALLGACQQRHGVGGFIGQFTFMLGGRFLEFSLLVSNQVTAECQRRPRSTHKGDKHAHIAKALNEPPPPFRHFTTTDLTARATSSKRPKQKHDNPIQTTQQQRKGAFNERRRRRHERCGRVVITRAQELWSRRTEQQLARMAARPRRRPVVLGVCCCIAEVVKSNRDRALPVA